MSRASNYQRFGMPKQKSALLSPEEKAAKDAGFSSVLEQQVNRTLRNQLEQTALGKGYTNLNSIYSEAQRAAGGGNLTSNATLQKMYEYVAGKGAAQQQAPVQQQQQQQTQQQPESSAPTGPSQSELMAQSLQQSIAAMQQNYMQSMQQQAQQFQQMQEAQNARMESLQNMMMQAQASQAERPTVVGVQSAAGSSGTPMQIARRGVSGAFGRRGMRIKGLNV